LGCSVDFAAAYVDESFNGMVCTGFENVDASDGVYLGYFYRLLIAEWYEGLCG